MQATSDPAPVSAQWQPTDDQVNFEISPVYDSIIEDLRDLKETTGCPDSFLKGMLESIALNFASP